MTLEEIQQKLNKLSEHSLKPVEWKVEEKYGLVAVEFYFPDRFNPEYTACDSRLLPYSKEIVTNSHCARIRAQMFSDNFIVSKEDMIDLRKKEMEADFE